MDEEERGEHIQRYDNDFDFNEEEFEGLQFRLLNFINYFRFRGR